MFQKLIDLVVGAGDALGVPIPVDLAGVSDAAAQITDLPGVTDAVAGSLEPST
jgi:hypothetical protein